MDEQQDGKRPMTESLAKQLRRIASDRPRASPPPPIPPTAKSILLDIRAAAWTRARAGCTTLTWPPYPDVRGSVSDDPQSSVYSEDFRGIATQVVSALKGDGFEVDAYLEKDETCWSCLHLELRW